MTAPKSQPRSPHEKCDARGRQRPGEQDVDARRDEAGLERGLEHVPREARVLADQHAAPVGRQHARGRAREAQRELDGHRMLSDPTAHPVRAEVPHAHARLSRIAPAAATTRSASTVSRTSCARMMRAPFQAATTAAARLPARRSPPSRPVSDADHPLAREAGEHRLAVRRQCRQARQQRQVVLEGLAEAEARIDGDARARDARGLAGGDAASQEAAHLGHHVPVAGRILHRAGLALHVHQADGGIAAGDRLDGARRGERGDVVHERSAGGDRAAHHGGLPRIDRDGNRKRGGEALDHRQDAPQFLVLVDRRGAGPGRLAADVDDRRAVRGHAFGLRERRRQVEKTAAVGKRVGRDVQDAHDHGCVEVEREAAALEAHACGRCERVALAGRARRRVSGLAGRRADDRFRLGAALAAGGSTRLVPAARWPAERGRP